MTHMRLITLPRFIQKTQKRLNHRILTEQACICSGN